MALFRRKKEDRPGLVAVTDGEVIEVDQVGDPAFASGSLGRGYGIRPTSGAIVSPVGGEVVTVFPTRHALTIRDDEGREVLVHMGIDTMILKGEGFDVAVEPGERVEAGQGIATIDLASVAAAGKDTCVVVTMPTSPDQQFDVLTGPTKAGATVAFFASTE